MRSCGTFDRQPPRPAPAQIAAAVNSVSLADAAPSSAKVGWLRPMRNAVPSDDVLLQASRQIRGGALRPRALRLRVRPRRGMENAARRSGIAGRLQWQRRLCHQGGRQ
ncbi:MAG: hypothetical protein R3F11_09585 [Verrucomicrobiales bacterium]